MRMPGRKAYNNMCGCFDCSNPPRVKSSIRRQEREEWQKDYEDEQLYPELWEEDND
jgi:hypothetical protein